MRIKKEWKYVGVTLLGVALMLTGYHFTWNSQKETIIKETRIETPADPKMNVHQTSLLPGMSPTMNSSALDFTHASEASLNSVVHVTTTVIQTQRYSDPMLELFFGPNAGTRERKFKGSGSGSGVIISDDGYIITNNHVVQNASEINIILNDNTEYNAEVIGTDPSTDLALLKINAQNLSPIKMGNSNDVKVGEWVLAVGNPFNLNSTVTAGIVSAKARNINIIKPNQNDDVFPIESFIQTDAAVNPGNSGGALVNTKGELIGINTAIASGTGYYTGYSFAIPINLAQKVIADLQEYGNVKRAVLGVRISDINQDLKEKENLSTTKGVYVAGTVKGGAAEKAGLKKGDIITKIDDKTINSSPELQMEIGQKSPRESVLVTLLRNGKEKMIPVRLKGLQEETFLAATSKSHKALGAYFEDADRDELKKIGIENGVKITKLHPGRILAAGVPKGFIITKIDNKEIKDAAELEQYLDGKKGGVLIEGYYPSGEKGYFGFGV